MEKKQKKQNLKLAPKKVVLQCFLIQNESYSNGNARNLWVFRYFQTELTLFLYTTVPRLLANTTENAFQNSLI